VTVGGAADQPEIEKKARRQTTPKILESFIVRAPMVSSVDDANPTARAEF
jgi:hypothetical protein